MTDKQQIKVLNSARNCTFYDDVIFKSAEFNTFKDQFFNAVLGRSELGYTQKDVSLLLGVSKRTVIDLEKGKSNNLKLVLNYISAFSFDFATEHKRKKMLENKYTVI